MELATEGAIWLGAGVTLVMLLSRRRWRKPRAAPARPLQERTIA